MSNSRYKGMEPIDLEKVSTYELASRPSKVTTDDFAVPIKNGSDLDEFLESLPNILAVRSLRSLADRIIRARGRKKPIIWGIGGHVIKTGLAPVLIDLLNRGFVTAIACNGSVLVHDAEIALAGFTSEDVDSSLGSGDFGAARETGELINRAAGDAFKEEIGLGEAVSRSVAKIDSEYSRFSLLKAAYEKGVPATAHVTVGADIGHFHPESNGADLGAASHRDFRLFCSIVREMNGGGVYLNCGSAVTMPEIFLKAVTVNRNLNYEISDITTANLDFISHYRPLTNVVKRPNANGAGTGFTIIGHHEINIPLLAAQIIKGS